MKLGSACLQCRQGKRKCEKPAPGSACHQCERRQLHCSSLKRASTTPAKLIPHTPSGNENVSLPAIDIILELIDLYICHIHDKPHTLFHEPSLKKSAKDGTAFPAILFAIFGLSARFSSIEEICS